MKPPGVPVRIVAVAAGLALGLVGLVVREGVARATGDEARVAITGYDPRALLTGHYVAFQLVDKVPAEQVCVWKGARLEPAAGELWLALRREGPAHRIVAAAPSRAAALRLGDLAVHGGGLCFGMSRVAIGSREVPEQITADVDIGVSAIHLEQDEAEALEKLLQGRDGPAPPSWAVISVGRDGEARLKGLIVGDRRVDLDWF